jgi:hypothetical protein
MGRKTASATDAAGEAAWAEYLAGCKAIADLTNDGTLLRDMRILWDEKAHVQSQVNSLSPSEFDIPDGWAEAAASERQGFMRAQTALNQGREYVDNGRRQVEHAVELAELLDERFSKEVQKSQAEYEANQAASREPLLRDITARNAELKDLERRLAELSQEDPDNAKQRAFLEQDVEFARDFLAVDKAGLEIIGDSTLAELLQSPTRALLTHLSLQRDDVRTKRRQIFIRRRWRHIARWASVFAVAVAIFVLGKVSDSCLPWPTATGIAFVVWLADVRAIEPWLKRSTAKRIRRDTAMDIGTIWQAKQSIRSQQAQYNAERREYGMDEVTLIAVREA